MAPTNVWPLDPQHAAEIRGALRDVILAHRRLYTLQTAFETCAGFSVTDIESVYEDALFPPDSEPISDLDLGRMLGTVVDVADGEQDSEHLRRFAATFPEVA